MTIFQPELFREIRTGRYMALTDAFNSVVGENNNTIGLVRSTNAPRIRLTVATPFFVSTTGSDSNTGLNLLSPWLTLQHAYNVLTSNYDFGGQDVTINIADGVYNDPFSMISGWLGGGTLTLLGNASSPNNVSLAGTATLGGVVITAALPGIVTIKGVIISSPTGSALYFVGSGVVHLDTVNWGSAPNGTHILSGAPGTYILILTPYSITGNSLAHFFPTHGGFIQCNFLSSAITLIGTLTFSIGFVFSTDRGGLECIGNTFVGSQLGPCYNAQTNSAISTNSFSGAYFPGGSVGQTFSGAIYN